MQHRFNRLFSVTMAAALLAGTSAGAAELGDIAVRSYLNQPLTADIELVMLTPDEAAEGVPVRLAGPNIYQGANVRMHPALAGARMSVQRKDQRLFVHLVTLQPVDADVLHLYLELGAGSRAVVRAATLWLTPEPPGAPRPPLVRPAPVASVMEAAPAGRSSAATPLRPAPLPPPVDMARLAAVPVHPTPAPVETATPPAPSATSATSDPALPGAAPSQAALLAARARAAAEREVLARHTPYGADLFKQAPQRNTSGLAACAPGKNRDQAKQCVVLDQKNTELNAKIRDLEGKVHALQVAVGAPVTATPGHGDALAVPSSSASHPASASMASMATAAPAASAAVAASAISGASAGAAASAASVAASSDASVPPAASAPVASAPMNPAGAVIPPSNGNNGTNGKNVANGKKERRSGLNATTQIVLGVLGAIVVLGGLTYFVRKKKLKFPPKEKLMFWKRWRRKKDQPEPEMEPQEPELGKDNE